jgi:hypothetical protein
MTRRNFNWVRGMGLVATVFAMSVLGITAGLQWASIPAYATERGEGRRDARDTRQEGREEARQQKAACKAGDEKSRAECRHEKRDSKQESREDARDIKRQ